MIRMRSVKQLFTSTKSCLCRFHINQNIKNKSSSSSSSSSDEDNASKSTKNSEALKKLNLLLKQMVEEDVTNMKSKIDLAKPKPKSKYLKMETKSGVKETAPVETQMVAAAKEVAESIGGNVKQTESELITKLLNVVKDEATEQPPVATISEVIKGMKIDRETKAPEDVSRAEQVRQILHNVRGTQKSMLKSSRPRLAQHQRSIKEMQYVKTDLFGSQPLGIFTGDDQHQLTLDHKDYNKTWKTLEERQLRLAVTQPPSNYFQEMILWTEQGKIWKFPIDNEQGMEEEQNICFTEHVFLEKHLEPWCPSKGPIRHFMELVCVGLSKNPYLTVQHKKEHIEWFRDYFNDKKQLLGEVGALDPKLKPSEQQS